MAPKNANELDPRYLWLEVDGPGVSQESIDSALFVRLAAAFLRLVERTAAVDGRPLRLAGVEVVDKCVALRVLPDDAAWARECAIISLDYVAAPEPPRGARELVGELREAMEALPPDHVAKVLVGPWSRAIPVPSHTPILPLDSLISVRARPLRVGGKTPAVRFTSDLEEDFTLTTSAEQARELGGRLYEDVDVEALVSRDEDGRIVRGQLREFFVVSTANPITAWRAWFKSVGGEEWDGIDDLRSALNQ